MSKTLPAQMVLPPWANLMIGTCLCAVGPNQAARGANVFSAASFGAWTPPNSLISWPSHCNQMCNTRGSITVFRTPTIFKSHLLPQVNYRKVIFLVRDGRDALVSYWMMMRQVHPDLSLEDVFSMEDELSPCSWEKYARCWSRNPYGADLMTLRYEDLLGEPLRELSRVSDFLGVARSAEELSSVIRGAGYRKNAAYRAAPWMGQQWQPHEQLLFRPRASGGSPQRNARRAARALSAPCRRHVGPVRLPLIRFLPDSLCLQVLPQMSNDRDKAKHRCQRRSAHIKRIL